MESVCVYCGCACKLNYEVVNNELIKTHGVRTDEVSEGFPCIKGLTIHECISKNKIINPTVKINGLRYEVSLEKAINYIHEKTKDLQANEVFFNTSGKITNEDNYVIQKFARVCYNTPNIDSCCSRLCHQSTVIGMEDIFGTPNITRMSNINLIDTLLIIGSEPEKDYPVFYNKIVKNKELKVIRVHSFIKGCADNECVASIKPGSETCLLNGLINSLIKKGTTSKSEGFQILKEKVASYNQFYVCKTCGIKRRTYNKLVTQLLNSKNLGVFHGMGLTQHVNSIENVHSLLNLVLLKKGKVLSLRGEVNVQGAGDLGGSPGLLPTGDLSTKNQLEKEWGFISEFKGLNIIEALMLNPVKALFLTEFNPLKSLPDIEKVKNQLSDSLIVYFGSHNNEASSRADVVIPIASLLESEGTITNGERRLRKVNPVINGNTQLWKILKTLAGKFGKMSYFNYKTSKDVFNELKKFVKDYQDINVNNLWQGNDEWANKEIKHERFMPENFDGLGYVTTRKYPFVLTTYRSRYAFLGDEVTKNSETLSKMKENPGFYFNVIDMQKLKIKEGDEVSVTSTTNSLNGKAYISDRIPKKMIGAFIHSSELPVNKLFPLKFDETSFTPNYKSVAVKVKKNLI